MRLLLKCNRGTSSADFLHLIRPGLGFWIDTTSRSKPRITNWLSPTQGRSTRGRGRSAFKASVSASLFSPQPGPRELQFQTGIPQRALVLGEARPPGTSFALHACVDSATRGWVGDASVASGAGVVRVTPDSSPPVVRCSIPTRRSHAITRRWISSESAIPSD